MIIQTNNNKVLLIIPFCHRRCSSYHHACICECSKCTLFYSTRPSTCLLPCPTHIKTSFKSSWLMRILRLVWDSSRIQKELSRELHIRQFDLFKTLQHTSRNNTAGNLQRQKARDDKRMAAAPSTYDKIKNKCK